MKFNYLSIEGKFYENEDRGRFTFINDQTALAILCDGMGGLSLGSEAAEIVSTSIETYIIDNYKKSDDLNLFLLNALTYADAKLKESSIANKSNMGTAVAVILITDDTLYYTWQGNVRIYANKDNKTTCLTRDHVLNIGYNRYALSRCLKGGGLRDDVPCQSISRKGIKKLYLCSDGFYNKYEHLLYGISFEDIKSRISKQEDDASLIEIYL